MRNAKTALVGLVSFIVPIFAGVCFGEPSPVPAVVLPKIADPSFYQMLASHIPAAGGVIAGVLTLIAEFAMRFAFTKKAIGFLHGALAIFKMIQGGVNGFVGLFEKFVAFTDSILPQNVVQPVEVKTTEAAK